MDLNHLTRRRLLTGASVTGGLTAMGLGLGQLAMAAGARAAETPGGAITENANETGAWYELGLMEDFILEQVLVYYLGHTWQGLADVSECLDAANRVVPGDKWSWARTWEQTAQRVQGMAESYLAAGHEESAGQAFMRASNYYIASLHRHPDWRHESTKRMTQASIACFRQGVKNLGFPVEEVRIPYEDTYLPGYFYRSPLAGDSAPTMIIFNGRDAWASQDHVLAEAGIRRGYHVLNFDGPGQGPVLRLQRLPFRPDWNRVVTPVVDFTLGIEGVDPKRIGVMGISMGGHLAPQAACFEHRPKVYVANPPSVDWSKVTEITIRQLLGDEGYALADTDPAGFDALIYELGKSSPLLEWGIDDTMWKHGASTPTDMIRELRRFEFSDHAGKIRSKMLFMHGVDDEWAQIDWLQKLLPKPAYLEVFDTESTGQLHCQTGAWAILCERLYNWLDDNLKV